ncbi:MAG: hypothetical protein LQ339_006793 [Xanthoria mediterranea]|nr:MAG: hypothetical protein LQ339_006793 [Xanthoria mediterranea]
MARKRVRGGTTHTRDSELQRKVDSGSWNQFLHIDARLTQKAFVHWYFHSFLPSSRSKELSKYTRTELQILIDKAPPNPINKNELLPETLKVIKIWENEQIPLDSAQWRVARVRLVADLLIKGLFLQLQTHHLLQSATPDELQEARCWIYQRSDGEYARYQPLAQPWCTKEIPWPYYDTEIKLADQSKALKSLPSAWVINSMDDVRISSEKFNDLIEKKNRWVWPSDRRAKRRLFKAKSQDVGHGIGRIEDWLELAMHSTGGSADEGRSGRDVNELVAPEIDIDSERIGGLREIQHDSSAFTQPPTPQVIQWTPINKPMIK